MSDTITMMPPSHSRLARLEPLLEQDPGNELLLADAADAAIAEAAFDRAEEWVNAGLALTNSAPAWRFRLGTLRIAQRRLDAAQEVLETLQATGGPHPAIAHNLAYVAYLRGAFAQAATLLKPWLSDPRTAQAGQQAAVSTLWLRAMHHAGELDQALAWTQEQVTAGTLAAEAAGVASLIALDLSHEDLADRLARQALDAGVRQVEPLLTRAGLALAARDPVTARPLLQRALEIHPSEGRTWSALGFLEMLDRHLDAAEAAFVKALESLPTHAATWQGLAWARVGLRKLPAAAQAADRAIELDPDDAESRGARAVVHALAAEAEAARAALQRARQLDPDSPAAHLAERILANDPKAIANLASFSLLRYS